MEAIVAPIFFDDLAIKSLGLTALCLRDFQQGFNLVPAVVLEKNRLIKDHQRILCTCAKCSFSLLKEFPVD